MKQVANIPLSRLKRAKQNRYNPLPSLTSAADLTRKLDAFEAGYLKETVNIWETLEQRDDLIRAVVAKRKKAVGRQGWTVLMGETVNEEQRAEGEAHAAALEYFYENLQCENGLDRAEQGGFKLLVRQMMDAIGKRFAVHEIVWRREKELPDPGAPYAKEENSAEFPRTMGEGEMEGSAGASPHPSLENLVTATFRFVPLNFFENTTGQLRYLESESTLTGMALEPGAWMITVGDGLMMATASAWMVKNMALNDWLLCSERNGRPGLRATTPALRDSPEWNELETALEEVVNGNAVVHSSTDEIEVIDLAAGTNIPFPGLVDRLDRMIAALWRGADLSTISRDRGYGASLQEKETCALEEDDAEMITETLNRYVDRWVIQYVFGEGVEPLAKVKVLVAPKECTTADIQIDEFLFKSGAALSLQETMSRYGRALPKPGERVLKLGRTEVVVEEETKGAESKNEFAAGRGKNIEKDFGASYRESSQTRTGVQAHNEQAEDASDADDDAECGSAVKDVNSRDGSPHGFEPNANTEEVKPGEEGRSAGSPTPGDNGFKGWWRSKGSKEFHNCTGQTSVFELLQGDGVQLSPYGDFPHARGLQRVDREAVEGMVAQFNSFRGRLGRWFGGVPFYVGHPDLPQANELADRKAYGWIVRLEAREEGLFGQVKWSEAGRELLKQAHFKYLSPYWEAKQIGTENGRGVFRPSALISAGLTNQPNIPVRPLANEEGVRSEAEDSGAARDIPMTGGPVRNVEAKAEAKAEAGKKEGIEQEETERTERREEEWSAPEREGTATGVRASLRTPVRIPNMHTKSVTGNIGQRRTEVTRMDNRRERVRQAVREKVQEGLSYDEGWRRVREEHREWFENER